MTTVTRGAQEVSAHNHGKEGLHKPKPINLLLDLFYAITRSVFGFAKMKLLGLHTASSCSRGFIFSGDRS